MTTMKILKITYKNLLAAMSAVMLFSGCSDKDDEMFTSNEVNSDAEDITINMIISAQNLSSRAEGHETTTATEAENYIDVLGGDFFVYILNEDGVIIGQFNPTVRQEIYNGYRLSGKLSANYALSSFRLLVMANWNNEFSGDYSNNIIINNTTLEDLYSNPKDFNFIYPVTQSGNPLSWQPMEGNGIPMFGVSNSISLPTATNGFVPEIEVGSINMLRALAKIVVVNGTDIDNEFELRSCNLSKYNTIGRFIPDGEANPDWNDQLKQVTKPSLPANPSLSRTGILFVPGKDNKSHTLYLPEMASNTGAAPIINIVATLQNLEKDYEIVLGEYNVDGEYIQGTCLDILRNHQYTYTITNVDKASIEVKVIVDDTWEVIYNMELE